MRSGTGYVVLRVSPQSVALAMTKIREKTIPHVFDIVATPLAGGFIHVQYRFNINDKSVPGSSITGRGSGKTALRAIMNAVSGDSGVTIDQFVSVGPVEDKRGPRRTA